MYPALLMSINEWSRTNKDTKVTESFFNFFIFIEVKIKDRQVFMFDIELDLFEQSQSPT